MKKIFLAILLVGVIGSIFVVNEANAATGGIKATIESVMATLFDHESRIAAIESKTTTVVANSQVPSLLTDSFLASVAAPCTAVNATATNPSEPEYVLGWCPDSGHNIFIIEDARVTEDSLIITNIQNPNSALPGEGLALCSVSETGSFIVGETPFNNAFLIDCTGGPTTPTASTTLIYTVFN